MNTPQTVAHHDTDRYKYFVIPGSTRNLVRSGLLSSILLIATLCPTANAEDDLGRLFFTPERRQNLDRQRQLNIQEKQEIPEDPTLNINGVVTRSSGKRTTWINGIPQNENDKQSGVSVISSQKNPGKIVVQSADAPAGKANVGDTVNRNTGEATNLLGGGQISIRHATPEKPTAN